MKQRQVLNDLSPDFKRDHETQQAYLDRKTDAMVDYIGRYVQHSGANGVMIGISGGVDSFVVGVLCAHAMKKMAKTLRLVILPNGVQPDYQDAKDSVLRLQEIYPEAMCDTVCIQNTYQAAISDLTDTHGFVADRYTLGNLQPRIRMMIQYALAQGLLVAGTDHATESITGFYTKYGDGGTDFNPIQELVKDDIYQIAEQYGAPKEVMHKQPAAGLGISDDDESELGMKYKDICTYLKGGVLDTAAREKLEAAYQRSRHKRAGPASPKDEYHMPPPVTHVHIGRLEDERTIRSAIRHINANPLQTVLYVQEDGVEEAFYTDVIKTTNTPIAAYNCFDAVGRNGQFGCVTENAERCVMVSGRIGDMLKNVVLKLEENGNEVTLLNDCLAK